MNKKIVKIEKILGTDTDGIWGKDDQDALNVLKGTKGPANVQPPQGRPGMTQQEAVPMEQQTYT